MHYRLYVFDGEDHIRHAFDLEYEGDAEAIAHAEAQRDGHSLELWQGSRRVIRIEDQ